MPTKTPEMKKMNATMSQMTPHTNFFFENVKEGASADEYVVALIKHYWAHLVKGNSHRSSRRLMHQKHLLSGR
jgi:hypothetical protein